jgi:lysophospholipase L1-like esterase
MNVKCVAVTVAALTLGCSGSSSGPASSTFSGGTYSENTGGATAATGGVASSSTGGTPAATGGGQTGGTPAATGGGQTGGTSFAAATGGAANGSGGRSSLGGAQTGGTSVATGGAANSSGGRSSSGGTQAGGGSSSVLGGLRWVGRVDASNPNAVRFAWQGAGFVATVTGSTIAVKLRTESTSTVYFQPVIDGTAGTRFNVDSGTDQVVTLASGLSNTSHQVELFRETEGMYGMSTFLGFTSGTVTGAPASSGRLLEVVGDSISAGYGDLGSEPHPNWVANPACHWTAQNSSWYVTYAAVAGHALNAEVSTVARSGWGMYRDNTNSASGVLSSVYERALGTTDTTTWSFSRKADVVVINLGTNDWSSSDPGTPFETAYVSFIAKVRSHYPDAWIFLTIGSMLDDPALTQAKTRLANVVATVTANTGDKKLLTFDFGTQNMGSDGSVPTGCDWHPNAADHKRMAGILQQQLSSKLGW